MQTHLCNNTHWMLLMLVMHARTHTHTHTHTHTAIQQTAIQSDSLEWRDFYGNSTVVKWCLRPLALRSRRALSADDHKASTCVQQKDRSLIREPCFISAVPGRAVSAALWLARDPPSCIFWLARDPPSWIFCQQEDDGEEVMQVLIKDAGILMLSSVCFI